MTTISTRPSCALGKFRYGEDNRDNFKKREKEFLRKVSNSPHHFRRFRGSAAWWPIPMAHHRLRAAELIRSFSRLKSSMECRHHGVTS